MINKYLPIGALCIGMLSLTSCGSKTESLCTKDCAEQPATEPNATDSPSTSNQPKMQDPEHPSNGFNSAESLTSEGSKGPLTIEKTASLDPNMTTSDAGAALNLGQPSEQKRAALCTDYPKDKSIAVKFKNGARFIHYVLKNTELAVLDVDGLDKFDHHIANVRVDVVTGSIIDQKGHKVDMRTYFDKAFNEHVIEVESQAWSKKLNTFDAYILIFHAYLMIMNYDDALFQISDLLKDPSIKQFLRSTPEFDDDQSRYSQLESYFLIGEEVTRDNFEGNMDEHYRYVYCIDKFDRRSDFFQKMSVNILGMGDLIKPFVSSIHLAKYLNSKANIFIQDTSGGYQHEETNTRLKLRDFKGRLLIKISDLNGDNTRYCHAMK